MSCSLQKLEKKKMALLSLFDPLYCQEENLELEGEQVGAAPPPAEDLEVDRHFLSSAAASEEEWAAVLDTLATKESETGAVLIFPEDAAGLGDNSYLSSARRETVEWVVRVAARHAFSALTALLAVNYLDRCFLSRSGGGLRLREDKPWMGRLAAVACLSLAAKVEETRVPLVLDLQVASTDPAERGGYVFEPKTIRRMELLVLSVLGWRMNPVTPLSFIHHVLPRLYSKDIANNGVSARIRELVRACEEALLSVTADRRWVRYPASAWAAAAVLHAAEASASSDGITHEVHRLIALFNASKGNVEECYHIIREALISGGDSSIIRKRKHYSSSYYQYYSCPRSPNGVTGSCFSYDSSTSNIGGEGGGDHCALWPSSVSSSPDGRPPKRLNSIASNDMGNEGSTEAAALGSAPL